MDYKKAKTDSKRLGIQDVGIELQKEVLALTSEGYWLALLRWPKLAEQVSAADRNLLIKASTKQGFMKIILDKEWKRLLELRHKCESDGFRNS